MDVEEREEVRFELIRRDIPIYQAAAKAGCHPQVLSRMLRGRVDMPADVLKRLRRMLAEDRPA